ncbi:nucleoside triphosphate pyrophosphohydrolase [Curtobacterium sp. SGAir0471]|uniref:MazG family protein n=1 Tax=Curtobacterium sp. SGAir0471 TaxID=2070337 RepID=UPI0010CD09F9|nr:MazG family protein [Curtobacterium sp. SGAir0471]QCR42764.1 nucleoside triphosphate pyrophosphohydrolase [Curtobacterium sp. SGAir0471]
MTAVTDLVEVVDRLLAPEGGCVWNRAQTHASLARYAVEESYELVDAIDSGDDVELREELGDLLYQVVLHAGLAATEGRFDLEDVAAGARDKMVRRHPHVFGTERADTEDEVVRVWRAAKVAEKASRTSVVDGVPRAMPPLERAVKLLERLEERGDAATVVAAVVRAQEQAGAGASADGSAGASASGDVVDERWGAGMLAEVAAAREAGIDVVASLRAAVTRLEAEARVGE